MRSKATDRNRQVQTAHLAQVRSQIWYPRRSRGSQEASVSDVIARYRPIMKIRFFFAKELFVYLGRDTKVPAISNYNVSRIL